MDYVLFSPEEAAELLNISPDEIVALVETGELAGLRVCGHWRIPLKSIAQLISAGVKTQTVRALEQVFNDHATWQRVFGAHPEVTQSIETGEFPLGSLGACLKEAISISRQQQVGPAAAGGTGDSGQDASYQLEPGQDARSA